MKKILALLIIALFFGILEANAVCIQCPQIQKQIKKEIKLTKEQKKEINLIKKDMSIQINEKEKEYNKNQKRINKILKADCPDIVEMMAIKNQNSELKKEILVVKKQAHGAIFDVYTQEQQYIAKRILSENTGIIIKKDCEFCKETPKLKMRCKTCKKK